MGNGITLTLGDIISKMDGIPYAQPVKDEWQELFDFIGEWSHTTFGPIENRGPEGPLKHLVKEAEEALTAVNNPIEYADCLIILFDAIRRAGMPLPLILQAAKYKAMVNKYLRKWPHPTNNAPVEHIREPNESYT